MQGGTHCIHEQVASFLLGPMLGPPEELPELIAHGQCLTDSFQLNKESFGLQMAVPRNGQYPIWEAAALTPADGKTD